MKWSHFGYAVKNMAQRPAQNLAVKEGVKCFYWPYYKLGNFYSDGAKQQAAKKEKKGVVAMRFLEASYMKKCMATAANMLGFYCFCGTHACGPWQGYVDASNQGSKSPSPSGERQIPRYRKMGLSLHTWEYVEIAPPIV
jgi:hypothetical protein